MPNFESDIAWIVLLFSISDNPFDVSLYGLLHLEGDECSTVWWGSSQYFNDLQRYCYVYSL
jgi:hypothetical protein